MNHIYGSGILGDIVTFKQQVCRIPAGGSVKVGAFHLVGGTVVAEAHAAWHRQSLVCFCDVITCECVGYGIAVVVGNDEFNVGRGAAVGIQTASVLAVISVPVSLSCIAYVLAELVIVGGRFRLVECCGVMLQYVLMICRPAAVSAVGLDVVLACVGSGVAD